MASYGVGFCRNLDKSEMTTERTGCQELDFLFPVGDRIPFE